MWYIQIICNKLLIFSTYPMVRKSPPSKSIGVWSYSPAQDYFRFQPWAGVMTLHTDTKEKYVTRKGFSVRLGPLICWILTWNMPVFLEIGKELQKDRTTGWEWQGTQKAPRSLMTLFKQRIYQPWSHPISGLLFRWLNIHVLTVETT